MEYTSTSAAFEALQAVESKLSAYRHAAGVLSSTPPPPRPKTPLKDGARRWLCSVRPCGLSANPENESILTYLEAHLQELDPVKPAKWELFRKSYNQISRIPPQEYVAYDVLLNDAQAVWEDAKNGDDF